MNAVLLHEPRRLVLEVIGDSVNVGRVVGNHPDADEIEKVAFRVGIALSSKLLPQGLGRFGARADGVNCYAQSPQLRLDELPRFDVQSLLLFGSVARDEAHEQSDVDLLVSFRGAATFGHYMGLKLFLEDLFGRRVDLVTKRALRRELRERVEREAIHVA
jgi:predicted nucleotidyltransferase